MESISVEALSRLIEELYSISPYSEQLQAVKRLAEENIIEMKTGEGKTLVTLMAAALLASRGRKVYVVSSNDYLIERDFTYAKPLYEKLGVRSVMFKEGTGGSDEQYENADIIYATGATLIFDYLRGINAEYDIALIDEIDFILVEESNHEFSVADSSTEVDINPAPYNMAKGVSDVLSACQIRWGFKKEDYLFDYQRDYDVLIDPGKSSIRLTDKGINRITQLLGDDILDDKYFIEILLASLRAKHLCIKGKHYIVQDEKIVIIDESTGRIMPNGRNDPILHSAIEVKEGLSLSRKSFLSNSCSFPVFFSLFKSVIGLSGTASLSEDDFSLIYGKSVAKIKEHQKNIRKREDLFFDTDSEVLRKTQELLEEYKDSPILIITDSDARSALFNDYLSPDKRVRMLDNLSLAKEEEYISSLEEGSDVLISSRIVGRGTNIIIPGSLQSGLIVIIPQRFLSRTAELQAIGRTGRNGLPGKVYLLTSLEDPIYLTGDKDAKSAKYIEKLQKRYEAECFAQRKLVYIKSKLFFDQDEATKRKLKCFASFDEMAEFAKKCRDKNISGEVARYAAFLKEDGITYRQSHKAMLLSYYERERLFYQQQHLRYNEIMQQTLFDNKSFKERCDEYLQMSIDVITTCILMLMVKAHLTEQERKSSIKDTNHEEKQCQI